MSLIFVYITNQNKEEARKISHYLIDKKLIACANIYDNVSSIYPWQGKITDEKECILIAKTTENNFNKIKTEVDKIHSYKVPCIIKIPIEANEKYAAWLKSNLKTNP